MESLLFTDALFLFLFAPIVLTLHWALPTRLRNSFLLLASVAFYAWGEHRYTLVLLASMALNYACGLAITRSGSPGGRRASLWTGVALNVGLLAFFKYLPFLAENCNRILAALGKTPVSVPEVHLPVGISFFTFMGLSYLADVYRRQLDADANPLDFGLYIALFPHLIAGPIVRYGKIAAELRSRRITLESASEGVSRFVFGLAKKVMVANTVAKVADAAFSSQPADLNFLGAWLGVICYSVQIYFDFSGYSDMAIGLARLLGFTFPENFNYPYVARSITEFWTRWHMSLSTWLRDYLFYGLGVRGGRARLYRNLLIVFFICGLWHGASWRFVAWGCFHGLLLVAERAGLQDRLSRWPVALQHGYALLAVMLGWVVFRADTMGQAGAVLSAMAGFSHSAQPAFATPSYFQADAAVALVIGVLGSAGMLPVLKGGLDRLAERVQHRGASIYAHCAAAGRIAGLATTFVISAALSAAGTYSPFIYFRF